MKILTNLQLKETTNEEVQDNRIYQIIIYLGFEFTNAVDICHTRSYNRTHQTVILNTMCH